MPIPTSEQELVELFRSLGAKDPEAWARSQVKEGIPQLLRFLFLQSAWESIPIEGHHGWIDSAIQRSLVHPTEPYAGLGQALARCKRAGVQDQDLTEIARCLQAQMLFSVSYLIDGPSSSPKGLDGVSWGLFQINESGAPTGHQIAGLYESVLEFDPTQREMRPRGDA